MSEVIPFRRPTRPQDLVLRFLNSVGHKRDAEFYLKLFTSCNPESFALIILEEEVLREDMDAVLFEIRYLMRLSLIPVVLLRSSNDFLEKLEIESYFKKANTTMSFLSDEYTHDEKLEFIRQRINKNNIPLLHLDPDLDVVSEITKLADLLRTGKIIFLRRSGGIFNQQEQNLFRIINLRSEYEHLLKASVMSETDLEFLRQSNQIIQNCDHKIFISIVSPNNLLRELFTVKGAGTLIQLGSRINTFESWDNIDPRSLKRLLEMSFERKIKKDFFTKLIDRFYIEENYMGAALLQKHNGLSYLSKFAVGTEARGLGIGRDLWHEIVKNHKKFFWRSDPNKFITHWYVKQCDGMYKGQSWTVFWKGLEPSEIQEAINFAINQESDFD